MFQKTLGSLPDDEAVQRASMEGRRAVYERSLDQQAMERAGKLSSGSVRVERQIEALRGNAYAALRSIPEYGRLSAKDQKAVRELITEELKRFQATAKSVSRGLFCLTCLIAISGAAQEEKSKPRVFVSPSKSWEVSGESSGIIGAAVGIAGGGGARPQTAEIIKTFEKRCPDVIVTRKQDKADYVVVLEHDGGKSDFSKDNKFVVFNHAGDSIKSGSTRTLGNAVKDACTALVKDWRSDLDKAVEEKSK